MAMERGILVNAQGYVLGFFQWDSSKPQPQFNTPRRGKDRVLPEDKKTLLPESAYEPGCEAWRWDFDTKSWLKPDGKVWFVDARGNSRGSRSVFADDVDREPVPLGLTLVATPPPVNRSRRPYWNGNDWAYANRVRILDDLGQLVNVELERPEDPIEIPEGWSKEIVE